MGASFSPEEFGRAFQGFMEWVGTTAEDRSPFRSMLVDHFGEDPSTFPVTGQAVALHDLPNLQLALDSYLAEESVEHQLVGFAGHVGFAEMSLSGLVHDQGFGLALGPVRRTPVPLADGRSLQCVTAGLFLVSRGAARIAVLVMQGERGFDSPGVRIDVMAPADEAGDELLADIRARMSQHNVYRGKVLKLIGGDEMMGGGMSVEFPAVPAVAREDIVLPEGVLEVVELHTVEFARQSETLRRSGRHLRRGLLLHGPPGTGKTLCSTYLISQLEHRTVVILTGSALGLIAEACAIARDLQPAMVVLEDVDLVAQDRTVMGLGATSLLFQLLNEMDGIGEDADVIFVMTTNRADLLEPALAARPGRVDQAVEFPLPDEEARVQLVGLFGDGLDLQLEDMRPIVAATEGVSPAFLRELVRKAALFAARDGSAAVTDEHFRQALDLLEQGGSVTRAMLGADGGQALMEAHEDWDDEDWDD